MTAWWERARRLHHSYTRQERWTILGLLLTSVLHALRLVF